MGSSLHQWETDPLFSAAEVVQDSADRMESIFRLLLHEQNLVQVDFPDPRLLTSMEYHKRDLATILETAKWQLEDFERAVSTAIVAEKSHMRGDVVSRRNQFIEAIREQINDVEKSLQDPSVGNSMRNLRQVNLNEQDRDGLALFLSGREPSSSINGSDSEDLDNNMLRRFLDPNVASSLKDGATEIVECRNCENENLSMNGVVHTENNFEPKNINDLRKVVSRSSVRVGLEAPPSVGKTPYNGHIENGTWDVEANEVKLNNAFPESLSTGSHSQLNIYTFLNNLWKGNDRRTPRNYTKMIKDGDIQRQASSYSDISPAAQGQHTGIMLFSRSRWFQLLYTWILTKIILVHGWFGTCTTRCQRYLNNVRVNSRLVHLILTVLSAIMFLGVLVSWFS